MEHKQMATTENLSAPHHVQFHRERVNPETSRGRKRFTRKEKNKGTEESKVREDSLRRKKIKTPKYEIPFRPQPGDVIVRSLPPEATLNTQMVLRVMGLIKVYHDDYYFVYEQGEPHVVRFTFRSTDRILRIGQFTSRIYTWRFEEFATLYLYWQSDRDYPGEWHKVAQQRNEFQQYLTKTEDEVLFNQLGHTTDEKRFQVMEGDVVIHTTPAVALDRPWGQSFELKIIPPHYRNSGFDHNQYFGAGDVVLRVRLSIPTNEQAASKLSFEVLELVADYVQEYVPMYVVGFLCLGRSIADADGGMLRPVWNGRWRYLGWDQQIFRDYRTVVQPDPSKAWQNYPLCPLLPGDIIINLDEVVHNPLSDPDFHQGHIKIFSDKEYKLDRPEDFPGSMIVRIGRFMSPEGRAASEIKFHRTRWLKKGERKGYMFSCWAEETRPKLIIHDGLSRDGTGWIDASIYTTTIFDEELPGEDRVDDAEVDDRSFGFDPQWVPLYHQVDNFRPEFTDYVLNQAVPDRNFGKFLSTPQSHIHQIGGKTYLQYTDEQGRQSILPNPDHTTEFYHWHKRTFNLLCYEDNYRIRDGDNFIRFKVEESSSVDGSWILSAELYSFSRIPQPWVADPARTEIYSFLGKDQIILPNQAIGFERRPQDNSWPWLGNI